MPIEDERRSQAIYYTDAELTAMSREQLLALKLELENKSTSIKAQLDEAIAYHLSTGKYSDPIWFAKAKTALAWNSRLLQRVNLATGQARRAKAEKNRATTAIERDYFRGAIFNLLREELGEERARALCNLAGIKAQAFAAEELLKNRGEHS